MVVNGKCQTCGCHWERDLRPVPVDQVKIHFGSATWRFRLTVIWNAITGRSLTFEIE